MPSQAWNQAVVTQEVAGVLYNAFTTAKSVINAQDLYSLYPNFFKLGGKMRITVLFNMSNIVTTPGTVTFQVMFGSIVVFSTGAVQLNASAHTLLGAKLIIDLTCQLTNTTVGGVVAKMMGSAELKGVMFTKTAGQTDDIQSDTVLVLPAAGFALGTAFDGTISQIVDFWAGFSINNAGNGIQVAQYDVEILN